MICIFFTVEIYYLLQQAGAKTTIVRTVPSSVISVAKPGVSQTASGKQTIVIAAPKSGTYAMSCDRRNGKENNPSKTGWPRHRENREFGC